MHGRGALLLPCFFINRFADFCGYYNKPSVCCRRPHIFTMPCDIIRLRRIGSPGTPNPTDYLCVFSRATVGDGSPVPHKIRAVFCFSGTLRTAFPTRTLCFFGRFQAGERSSPLPLSRWLSLILRNAVVK